MYRTITQKLLDWKNSTNKKPLVLKGARQVGKTYSLLHFGKTFYEEKGFKCHYIDFHKAKYIYSIFNESKDAKQIIKYLQFRLKIKIDINNDLLIFDEIQECPDAITSLKYFEQEMKGLDIIAAGSHLGLMQNEASFPVGKVNFLYMFPLNFDEYVKAVDPEACRELEEYKLIQPLPQVVHERLLEVLTIYMFTGGLPEVVTEFINTAEDITNTILAVRKIQKELITGYCADFTKYSGVVNASHIQYVFDSIPAQLSKSHDDKVNKFIFKDVIPKRKGFEHIRGPLGWLIESRLCIKSIIVKKALHPLKSYSEDNKFKVYLFDTGILNCLLDIPGEVILGEKLGPFKGFIVENFIAQELFSRKNEMLISWQEATAELEFLLNLGVDIIPLEVKSSSRSRMAKSLDAFIQRYNPPKAFKMSAQNFGINKKRKFTTVPLYCSGKIF